MKRINVDKFKQFITENANAFVEEVEDDNSDSDTPYEEDIDITFNINNEQEEPELDYMPLTDIIFEPGSLHLNRKEVDWFRGIVEYISTINDEKELMQHILYLSGILDYVLHTQVVDDEE